MDLAIVDIETTGTRLSQDRILEIGVMIVKNNQITNIFTTLVNPKQYIPQSITDLTGISAKDVIGAPEFHQIAEELHGLLKDNIFVAHNAAFDYGFIRAEFERIGIPFHAKTLCTVRLSRKLFPLQRRHSLSHIIDRFKIETEARHRALADAQALWEFLQILPKHFDPSFIEKNIQEIIKTQRVPPQLSAKLIKDLPKSPGVYIFYDQNDAPLYIGKSINIQERVKQHLQSSTRSSKELEIFTNLARIEAIRTAGELSALLLESHLIKNQFPLYNRKLRKTKKLYVLKKALNEYQYIGIKGEYLEHIETNILEQIMGIFTSQKQALAYLEFINQKFSLCPKLLQLEKTKGPCFHYHLKKCKGSCIQKESHESYNERTLLAFETTRITQWPYQGAITIKETSEDGLLQENITIDQWCIVDHEKLHDPNLFPLEKKTFNVDEYKIIHTYIKTHMHKLNKTVV